MKTLTNEEIIYLIDEVCTRITKNSQVCDNCPLAAECLHYFTGENCGSTLENNEGEIENE